MSSRMTNQYILFSNGGPNKQRKMKEQKSQVYQDFDPWRRTNNPRLQQALSPFHARHTRHFKILVSSTLYE